jgi:hypothetical protein
MSVTPIAPEWLRFAALRGRCVYCRSPLRFGDVGFVCNRCATLQRKMSMASYELTEEELYELEEYSRLIHAPRKRRRTESQGAA